MTHLENYYELISHRDIVVGYWIEREIQNLIEDMQNPRYVFDTGESDKRIHFMTTLCLQGKAPYYGKPLELMPWELAFIESLYSFKMADTGLRRFVEAILEIGRKNGKSTLLAGDCNVDLFVGDPGTDVCCGSNADNQAKFIWREVAGMRYRLDPKKKVTSQNLVEIRNDMMNITVSRMSSLTQNKDGGNFSKVYYDEAHDERNANSELAEALWRSMSTKDDPLFICTTTQGFSPDGCYLDKKIAHAKGVIKGEIDDERFLPFLYEQDDESEIWQNEASWEKANPSIRYGVKKIEKLRRDVDLARTDKETRLHLLTKDFNLKQSGGQSWLKREDYTYDQQVYSLEDFRGCKCLAGLDCSQTTDLTNLKLLFLKKGDPRRYVFSRYWIPEEKLKMSDDRAGGAKYAEWIEKGLMSVCPGAIVDLTEVARFIEDIHTNFEITVFKLGYDPAYAREFEKVIDELDKEMREAVYQRQLSAPMKWCEREFEQHLIEFSGNPIDTWCLSNACCFIDSQERYTCKKSTAAKRIDGAVVFIILYAIFMRYKTRYEELL